VSARLIDSIKIQKRIDISKQNKILFLKIIAYIRGMIKQTKMILRLASVGNPDLGQDPNRPLYGCDRNHWRPVMSYKEASEVASKWISDNDLGAGNWSGGEIAVKGTVVAHVSYNGRVWEVSKDSPKWSNNAKEILV
jgi:hypothetical protein